MQNPAQLQAQLRDLERERREVDERLRGMNARGPKGRGGGARGGANMGRGAWGGPRLGRAPWPEADPPAHISAAQPRKLSSMVVVVGGSPSEEGRAQDPAAPAAATAKRPADDGFQDRPEVKSRNRRLFGALMGTLQKFRDEEERNQGSQAAQRRVEAQAAAERRARELTDGARAAAAENAQRQREEQLSKRQELDLMASEKRMELDVARALARRDALDAFVRTETQPALLWRPLLECDVVKAHKKAQREESDSWRRAQLQELAERKAVLRAKAGGSNRGEAGPGGEAGGEEMAAAGFEEEDAGAAMGNSPGKEAQDGAGSGEEEAAMEEGEEAALCAGQGGWPTGPVPLY